MAGRKSDFTLTKLDDLFSTQEQRDEEKLSKIRDIPLTEIDDFPDHPFKVRDDEDMLRDNIERLRSALCYLSETQKRRVIKYFFYGKTLERIANEEGVNFTSVRESINSSIKKLRKFF